MRNFFVAVADGHRQPSGIGDFAFQTGRGAGGRGYAQNWSSTVALMSAFTGFGQRDDLLGDCFHVCGD
jgi:hypothetical protein